MLDILETESKLDDRIWGWSRSKGWMVIKRAMGAAGIVGNHATPKGLRHSFAVHALRMKVPLNLIQRWLGHARIETTSIYTNVIGEEERRIAFRMWE
jgi:site-specific recombinase XerD